MTPTTYTKDKEVFCKLCNTSLGLVGVSSGQGIPGPVSASFEPSPVIIQKRDSWEFERFLALVRFVAKQSRPGGKVSVGHIEEIAERSGPAIRFLLTPDDDSEAVEAKRIRDEIDSRHGRPPAPEE